MIDDIDESNISPPPPEWWVEAAKDSAFKQFVDSAPKPEWYTEEKENKDD